MQSSDFGALVSPQRYASGGLAQASQQSEARATPRNPVLGGLADLLTRARSALQVNPHQLTTLGGTTINTPSMDVGKFLLGQTPELLDDVAHGSQMFTQGPQNGRPYIPELLPAKKQQLSDAINAALNLQPLAGPALKAAKTGAKVVGAGASAFVDGMADAGTIPARSLGQAGAVRPKGGNWAGVNLDKSLSQLGTNTRPEVQAWRDNQLNRYIKTYVGTADDPLLKLEQEGKLHLTPEQLDDKARLGISKASATTRDAPPGEKIYGLNDATDGNNNFPASGNQLHRDVTGRDYRTPWENISDDTVYQRDAAGILDSVKGRNADQTPDRYKWLEKQDPNTWLLDASDIHRSLGFDHVLDFLHQSNLSPEQLKNVSVPDAVRMTSQWNAQAAKRMADDQAGAMASGTRLHKDYGDGMKWVQIGGHTAEDGLPEGLALQHEPYGSASLIDAKTGDLVSNHPDADAATQAAWKPYVDKGLDAEGNAMGHCVGGYCDDVEKGTKIYSLRDKNNQPHVTIEAKENMPSNFMGADQTEQLVDSAYTIADDYHTRLGDSNYANNHVDQNYSGSPKSMYNHYIDTYGADQQGGNRAHKIGMSILKDISPEAAADHQAFLDAQPQGLDINQIKGKQNAAPVAKYLPYVQDFVKSGKWAEVQDLENAGLHHVENLPNLTNEVPATSKYLTPEEGYDYMTGNGVSHDSAIEQAGLTHDYTPITPPDAN